MTEYRNPFPTVDIIIELLDGSNTYKLVLIERKNEPKGCALPGGFVDYGESCEQAAIREAKEETGLDVRLRKQLGVYSNPNRDPRQHNMSVVYVACAEGEPKAGDDAKEIVLIPAVKDHVAATTLVFDHEQILSDYFEWVYNNSEVKPNEMLKRIGGAI